MIMFICFFKQKTAYEMRISDWSSDVCSSDLLAARQRILVDDVQRAVLLRHMDTGDGAPRAADGIECLALPLLQPADLGEFLVDESLQHAVGAEIGDPQRPERQGDAVADLVAVDRHQFQAAATEIAHHATGLGDRSEEHTSELQS